MQFNAKGKTKKKTFSINQYPFPTSPTYFSPTRKISRRFLSLSYMDIGNVLKNVHNEEKKENVKRQWKL